MAWKDAEARKEYDRKWAAENSVRRQAINAKWQQSQIDWLREFKKTLKCSRCPEDHPACLQFHHMDPTKKDLAVSNAVRSWSRKRLLAEIEKCEVLCANCHAKEHHRLREADNDNDFA